MKGENQKGGVVVMWLSSVVAFAAAFMMLAGLALILHAGVHFVRVLRAEVRAHRR